MVALRCELQLVLGQHLQSVGNNDAARRVGAEWLAISRSAVDAKAVVDPLVKIQISAIGRDRWSFGELGNRLDELGGTIRVRSRGARRVHDLRPLPEQGSGQPGIEKLQPVCRDGGCVLDLIGVDFGEQAVAVRQPPEAVSLP